MGRNQNINPSEEAEEEICFVLMCWVRESDLKACKEPGTEQRENYNPQFPTAFVDIAVINQLDIDLMSLKMKVKCWEDDNQLVLTSESDHEMDRLLRLKISQFIQAKPNNQLRSQALWSNRSLNLLISTIPATPCCFRISSRSPT